MPETASDDLIERLRDCIDRYGDGKLMGLMQPKVSRQLLIDAADRLAALQQRVEELERDVHVAVAHAQSAISDRKGRNAAAEARERVLREALAELREQQRVTAMDHHFALEQAQRIATENADIAAKLTAALERRGEIIFGREGD